jgi:hypothetical protein
MPGLNWGTRGRGDVAAATKRRFEMSRFGSWVYICRAEWEVAGMSPRPLVPHYTSVLESLMTLTPYRPHNSSILGRSLMGTT